MNDETERALDGYLIALAQGGSREAFDLRRWTPRLLRYASRVLGRSEAARDAVQETWIGVIRGLKRIDDTSRLAPWLYSIAHRKCVDAIRFDKRRRRLAEGVEQESAVDAAGNRNRRGAEENEDLTNAISTLSLEHREVVHLFYGEDLNVDDIASVLGVPVGTVKSRLHHARESLRKFLGE